MLEVVSSILRQYKAEHGLRQVPIKTAFLKPYVEERGHVDRIELEEVDFEAKNIVARVIKYRGAPEVYAGQLDLAKIQFARNQNTCWRRFGVCKELFHCMIDQQMSDRVSTIENLRTLTEQLVADTTVITGAFPPIDKEQQAEFLALETLLPVEHRLVLETRLRTGDLTVFAIADRFKIPEFYVRLAFQQSYLAAARALRGKLINLDEA